MKIGFSLIDFDVIFPIQSSIGNTISSEANHVSNTRCKLLARDSAYNFSFSYINYDFGNYDTNYLEKYSLSISCVHISSET